MCQIYTVNVDLDVCILNESAAYSRCIFHYTYSYYVYIYLFIYWYVKGFYTKLESSPMSRVQNSRDF